ncbi:MAG: hypothetical protein HPY80_00390 [Bacteroidales bacterium]|nr:hypothetical protein [Bacteroidales bacterium]
MQENLSQNAIFFIIERLKTYFQIVTDIELAKILGIKPNTISTWRNRNSIDWNLIFAKCENINLNWLLTGEGSMLRTEDNQIKPANSSTSASSPSETCPYCFIKDKLISSQQATIDAQKKTIKLLEKELELCVSSKKLMHSATKPDEIAPELKENKKQ